MKKFALVFVVLAMFFVFSNSAMAVQPLDKGMVVFTFDDGFASLYKNVFPVLKKYGIAGTAYILTGPAYMGTSAYITKVQAWEMYLYGIEMGNHTELHKHWATLTDAQILAEVVNCQNDLIELGMLNLGAFTPPFGDPYDYSAFPGLYARMVKILKQAGFPTSSRVPWDDTDIFNVVGNFDPFKINSYQLMNGRNLADIKVLINEAATQKKLLVFTIHNVLTSGGDLDLALFNSVVQYAASQKSLGKINIVTMSQVVSKMLHYQNLP